LYAFAHTPSLAQFTPHALYYQAIHNFLSNARKFSGDPAFRPGAARVLRRVTLIGRLVREENNQLVAEIGVQDTGVGICAKDKAHLFEPYHQLRHGKAQGTGGAGLGLALVKLLVGMHGGDVHVYSCENVGSRFSFAILFETVAGDSAPSEALLELKIKKKYYGRILVVEDMTMLRMSLYSLYRSCGLNCDVAADGETAVAMMRAAHCDPNHEGYAFVLMDNGLGPGINGPEAIRQIIEFDGCVTPIYGLTAQVLPADMQSFMDAGAVRRTRWRIERSGGGKIPLNGRDGRLE
jgi:CheY-like chemotaxis protein